MSSCLENFILFSTGLCPFSEYYSQLPGYHLISIVLQHRLTVIECYELFNILPSSSSNDWLLAAVVNYPVYLNVLFNTCRHLIDTNISIANYTRRQLLRRECRQAWSLTDLSPDLLANVNAQSSSLVYQASREHATPIKPVISPLSQIMPDPVKP